MLVAVAWTLVAAELFLRAFAPVPMLPRFVEPTYYGVRGNSPDMQFLHRTRDYEIQIRINKQGMRADREFTYEKPPGVTRIVVLGDSFGLGYEVDLQNTFLSRMEQRLTAAGRKVEVINLSVSGHGTAEELLVLQNEGLRYFPDLVLLVWHETDYQNNAESRLFRLDERGRLVREAQSYLPAEAIRAFLARIPGYQWLSTHSQAFTFLREKGASWYKIVTRFLSGSQRYPALDEINVAQVEYPPVVPEGEKRLALALLQRIKEESTTNGAALLILDVPVRISRSEFYSSFPRGDEGAPLYFNVVNPIPVFEQHEGELLYWEQSHGHFTPLACRLVGEELATAILTVL